MQANDRLCLHFWKMIVAIVWESREQQKCGDSLGAVNIIPCERSWCSVPYDTCEYGRE